VENPDKTLQYMTRCYWPSHRT